MKPRRRTTPLWLIASLGVSGCDMLKPVPGDFCDVVKAPIEFEAATAAQVVATDRASAERIDVQNTYGREHCPGAGWRS